jgi:glycosyltransferase involved in cell wall biosynthesis
MSADIGLPSGRSSSRQKAGIDILTPRITLFSNSWVMGGVEEHLYQLGLGLVNSGFPVSAILSSRDAIHPLREALSGCGVQIYSVEEHGHSIQGAARRLRDVTRVLQHSRPDILHLHFTGHAGGDLVTLASRLAGVRTLIRTDHNPPVPPLTLLDRLLIQWRDRSLARLIVGSRQTRLEHVRLLGRDPDKVVAFPYCVDTDRFSPTISGEGVRAELGIDPDAPVVGAVARLSESRKGMAYFVDMAAIVVRAMPEVRFVIVGDGALRPELERQTAKLGISDQVTFTGHRVDLGRVMAVMDVFVMPSLYESGPYSVLEAMAMGKPTVATRVGLVPELIQDGVTGISVPCADSQTLADAVSEILSDADLAVNLGRRGHDLVRDHFSYETMIGDIVSLYRSLAGSRPEPSSVRSVA